MARKSDNDSKQRSLLQELSDLAGQSYAYYVIFLYCPEYLDPDIKTFDDLCNRYQCMEDKNEKSMKKGLYRDNVQESIKILLTRIDKIRDAQLMDKYYRLAMSGDVQALKAYLDFKGKFFAHDEEGELSKILGKINLNNVDDTDDDFQMVL